MFSLICWTDFTEVGWRDDQRKELCKFADGCVLATNFTLLIPLLYIIKKFTFQEYAGFSMKCGLSIVGLFSWSRTELSECF